MGPWRIRAFGVLTGLLAAGNVGAPVLAQADVTSVGGVLVRREVMNEHLTAQWNVDLYREPRRVPFLPFLWRRPERAGEIEAGQTVKAVGVMETFVWQRRFVWMEVRLLPATEDDCREAEPEPRSGWIMLGPEHLAIASVWDQWERSDRPARP